MDPNQEIENLDELTDEVDAGETVSVDDFIRELEAKEKDLHITADTTFIEMADEFDDGDELPDFLRPAATSNGSAKPAPPVSAENAPVKKPADTADLEATIARMREKIDRLEADRDEMFKSSQRRARDLETLKTRTERERKETFQSQVGNLATQMLPALDNLNRALDFAGSSLEEKGAEFKQFYDGIVLVSEQVNEVFARMGVTLIPAVGREFDPHLHEAVATEVNDELAPNTISEELLRGYKMGEKIIRHSMVKVSQPSQKPTKPPADGDIEMSTVDSDTGAD